MGPTSFPIKALLNNSMPDIKRRELLPDAVYSPHRGENLSCLSTQTDAWAWLLRLQSLPLPRAEPYQPHEGSAVGA